MAVVGTAEERFGSRQQSYDGNVWKAQRSWLVKTDTWSDDANTVSVASGLPAYGEAHPAPIAAAMYCKTIAYAQLSDSSPMVWTVTADYDSDRQFDPTNPVNDEILTSFTSELYDVAIDKDLNGDGIVNSAGDPFDPTASYSETELIARIQSNHIVIPPSILSYQNAVNSDGISIGGLSIGVGQARHSRMEVSNAQKRQSTTYYSLTQEIHIRKEGWQLKVLDQGMNEFLLGKKRPILDDVELQAVTKPVPLNGSGVAITTNTPGDITFLEFKVHQELPFSGLPGIS